MSPVIHAIAGRLHILPALAALLLAAPLRAQDLPAAPNELRRSYGVYGDFNLNIHTADFRAIPGVPNCCPEFESGSGAGFSFGLLYELPLAERLTLGLRAGYGDYSALLKRTETTLVDREGGTVTGEFEHTIDAKVSTIGLEPLAGYRLFGGLTAHLGLRVAYMPGPTFAQKEVLTQPSVGTFAGTSSRVRNQFSGDLPGASSFSAGALGGLSYELPMNRERTLLLAPEVLYGIGFTNVVSGLAWRVGGLRAGLAVKYSPRAAEDPTAEDPPVIAVQAPPVVETPAAKPALVAGIRAVGLRDDGVEEARATLRVEEFLSTRLRPLLNYLFFDEGSSTIPDRYRALARDEAGDFHVEKLYNEETLPTYYHLLNIVGRRLVEHPEASITIVGCNSDLAGERGNTELSRGRAIALRDYLRDVWGIAEGRMTIQSRGLPATPSNSQDPDGIVENRRAEIHSDTWEIIAPVVTHDTLRSANPPAIRFHGDVHAQAGVAGWSLTVMQRGEKLREFAGTGNVPAPIEWRIGEKGSLPRHGDSLTYRLDVRDAAGGSTTATSSIAVEQVTVQRKRRERIADREIDRFSLILFDFDRSELNDANRRIVRMVTDYIKPTSTVAIAGHTDRMGEESHNRELSQQRAAMAARALGVEAASAQGLGEGAALYDNDLPEGRFYNRTVEIAVETPVEE
jgi:outer membrane protein OmpA-like peptidoglycan-associated protein